MKKTLKESGGSILFRLYFIIISLVFVSSMKGGYAQEYSEDEIVSKLEQVVANESEDYLDQLEEIGEMAESYIEQKSGQCSGEYASFVINTNGEKELKNKKLTKKEANMCHYMLMGFRIKYTKLAFQIRKKQLKKQHERQKQELEAMEKKRVHELEALAKKYKQ